MAAHEQARTLRLPEVLSYVGLSKSTVYGLMRRDDFPKPIRLARRAIAWRKDDLDAWIDARERVDLSSLEDDGE